MSDLQPLVNNRAYLSRPAELQPPRLRLRNSCDFGSRLTLLIPFTTLTVTTLGLGVGNNKACREHVRAGRNSSTCTPANERSRTEVTNTAATPHLVLDHIQTLETAAWKTAKSKNTFWLKNTDFNSGGTFKCSADTFKSGFRP